MSPERLAEILQWNQAVFESEARRDPDSLAGRIICAVQEAIETEREACAKVCELVAHSTEGGSYDAEYCARILRESAENATAEAIRQRNKQ